jgi:hypothetical protein
MSRYGKKSLGNRAVPYFVVGSLPVQETTSFGEFPLDFRKLHNVSVRLINTLQRYPFVYQYPNILA